MVSVRVMVEEDLKELARSYVKAYTVFDVGGRWTEESALKLLTYWFERQADLAFTAEEEGMIVGGLIMRIKPWWDGNHLVEGEIVVDPDHQAKGIGTELFKILFRKAKERYQATEVDTVTFRKFEHPLSWYKKMGFRENEELVIIEGSVDVILNKLQDIV